ncbi:MAG: SPOR domain-containing protein [Mangrovicoccus sp.]
MRFAFALIASLVWNSASWAAPSEMPPEGFDAPRYVDSQGCVFLRVDIDGDVGWAQRLTEDQAPLCGQEPSFPAQIAASPDPTPETAEETETAVAEPKAEPKAEPVTAKPRVISAQSAKWRRASFPMPGAYIQIGIYAEPENEVKNSKLLAAQGYQIWRQEVKLRQGPANALYAGPFEQALAEDALASVKALGFADAFLRMQN